MRRGFTLFELLVVIVIIGVLVMMVGISFSGGTDAVRIRTATRGLMQMSKYARTMALLHQSPLDLVFTSDGTLSVAEIGSGSGGLVSESAFGVTNAAAAAQEAEAAAEGAAADKGKDGEPDPSAASKAAGASGDVVGGGGYVMADTAIEKKYTLVTFAFDGYTDSVETKSHSSTSKSASKGVSGKSSEEEDDDETVAKTADGRDVKTFRVRYKSNGTCRPYRVKIGAEGDEASAITVEVDMLGTTTVLEDE